MIDIAININLKLKKIQNLLIMKIIIIDYLRKITTDFIIKLTSSLFNFLINN